jgi:hypothetical protein
MASCDNVAYIAQKPIHSARNGLIPKHVSLSAFPHTTSPCGRQTSICLLLHTSRLSGEPVTLPAAYIKLSIDH